MKAIINASPQIFSAKANILPILKSLYGILYTTSGIMDEIETPLKKV